MPGSCPRGSPLAGPGRSRAGRPGRRFPAYALPCSLRRCVPAPPPLIFQTVSEISPPGPCQIKAPHLLQVLTMRRPIMTALTVRADHAGLGESHACMSVSVSRRPRSRRLPRFCPSSESKGRTARSRKPLRENCRSDRGEPLDRIREAFHEMNEQRRLCIGFRPPLLPVLQGAYVRAQIGGKQSPRDFEALANAHQLPGCELGSRLEVERMRAKSASSLPRLRERRHAFRQFGKQIALVRTSPLRPCPCHVALLASSSALSISFNALRCFGVKSSVSSLSYSVYSHNCIPALHQ